METFSIINLNKIMSDPDILIYAYGNPGRQDDGLGNALIEKLNAWVNQEGIEGISFDSNYQLNIEDAAEISNRDLVIFVDASAEDINHWILTPVDSESNVSFTTHSATPGYIVGLCKQIYGRMPATYLLHIKGYEWKFKEELSPRARRNLDIAFEEIVGILEKPEELIKAFTEF